jgi:hypothetical protein
MRPYDDKGLQLQLDFLPALYTSFNDANRRELFVGVEVVIVSDLAWIAGWLESGNDLTCEEAEELVREHVHYPYTLKAHKAHQRCEFAFQSREQIVQTGAKYAAQK